MFLYFCLNVLSIRVINQNRWECTYVLEFYNPYICLSGVMSWTLPGRSRNRPGQCGINYVEDVMVICISFIIYNKQYTTALKKNINYSTTTNQEFKCIHPYLCIFIHCARLCLRSLHQPKIKFVKEIIVFIEIHPQNTSAQTLFFWTYHWNVSHIYKNWATDIKLVRHIILL